MIETPSPTTRRRAVALGAAALLLLPACSAGDSSGSTVVTTSDASPGAPTPPSPAPSSPTGEHDSRAGAVSELAVTVAGGEVQGPGDRVEAPLGSAVRLTVTSDSADEVHVHGYDETAQLQPGTPATIAFQADIPGVFEVELHASGLRLTSLQVQ